MWYKERMAPEGIKVFNPAFDVTDHEPDCRHRYRIRCGESALHGVAGGDFCRKGKACQREKRSLIEKM